MQKYKNLSTLRDTPSDFFCIFARYSTNKMEFLRAIFEFDYLLNAVIACILSGITCGIIGTYIVARRMVFLCGGITHASFGGIGVAFYFGLNPILGAMLFAILSALGIEWSSSRSKIRQDSAIGVMWGLGMAIGALFLYLTPGYASGNSMASFLFGSIVAVTKSDIIALALLASALLVGGALWHRQVMYVAFDREFARASGVRVGVVSYVMAVITAVAIVLSIRVMGIILLMSLFTMPVIGANMLCKSYTKIVPIAVATAIFGGLSGIAFSYYTNVPTGPAIIFVLAIMVLIIKLLSLWINRVKGVRKAHR